MENMDNGLTMPKWALIARPKIPQIQSDINEKKKLHQVSVVRDYRDVNVLKKPCWVWPLASY